MNTPPFLIGAALLFWAAQAGWLWLGALAAVVLEAPRLAKTRLQFAQADLDRIWNLCFVLFFGAMVVAFVTSDGASALNNVANNNSIANRIDALNKGGRSVILVLLWLPLIYLPIAVAQAFSEQERMDWSTFSWWLRRQRGKNNPRPAGSGLNVAWPYFALCLLASSAANQRTLYFPIGIAVLAGWALWSRRSKSVPIGIWVAFLLMALSAAFTAELGMRQMQMVMQRLESTLIARFASGRGFEPKEQRTGLGSVGRMKLSGSIVLHVEATGMPPALLREASYKLFIPPATWVATKRNFHDAIPETDLTTWKLLPNKPTRQQVTISGFLSGGSGLLPMPNGVAKIFDLPAVQFETNQLGAMNVAEGPGFYRVQSHYDEGASIDSPPDSTDEDIPKMERPALKQIAEELMLRDLSPAMALKKVSEFFAREFQYTTWQGEPKRSRTNDSPLTRFLLQDRAGHCEHFATATVLLLREAGIPARYAVGYSVQEPRGGEWIVRERHGHAWCLAWVDGAWRDVDTTPGSWAALESTRATFLEKISDAWSSAWFAFSKWRWGPGEWKQYVLWLIVPLILIAGWRLMSQKQWNRARDKVSGKGGRRSFPGIDSEFYLIEKTLAAHGLERQPEETLASWMKRVTASQPAETPELAGLLSLHYRLRFDPSGLNARDRENFRTNVESWLARHESAVPSRRDRRR